MTTHTLSEELASRARWSTVTGVLTAAVGAIMIAYPLATAAVSTVFLGSALIFAAVAQLVFALTSDTAGSFFLKLLLAVVYGIAGVTLAFFPLAGVVTLTLMLGAMLVAEAFLETALAFSLPAPMGRGWLLFGALTSLLFGLLILFHWPGSSAWAIGTLVGVAVLFNGIVRVAISGSIRREVRSAQRSAGA